MFGRPSRSVRGVPLLLIVAGLALVTTSLSAGVFAPAPASPSATPSAAAELRGASTSLAAGQGPATAAPLACTASAGGSESCAIAGSHPDDFPATSTWTDLTAKVIPAPSPRTAQMVWDASDGYVLLYGGESKYSGVEQYYGQTDTWTYLNGVWTNISRDIIGGSPPGSINPGIAYDPWDQYVVLFGGSNASMDDQDSTWTYHADEWTNITNTAGTPPDARIIPALVADLAAKQMILFGGLSLNTSGGQYAQSDTWLYRAGAWSNITAEVTGSPQSLGYAIGAYDPAESGILFTGVNLHGPPYVSNTFLYTAGVWTNLTATVATPAPLQLVGVFDYFPAANALVLAASVEIVPSSGETVAYPITWTFYEGNWVNITNTAGTMPSASIAGSAMMPDGSIFAFGGSTTGANVTADSYAFSVPPVANSLTVTPQVVDLGSPVAALANVSYGVAPFAQNFSWGDGTSTGGTAAADHTYVKTGTYNVTYNATDFEGRSVSLSTHVTVNPALATSPVVGTPSSPAAGTGVTFSTVASGGTPPYTYGWSFGDGTSATGSSATHTYSGAGTFTVTVTVNDSTGSHVAASATIVVTAAPSGFSLFSGTGLYLLIGVIVAIVVIAAVVLALRSRGKRSPPAAAWSPPPAAVMAPPTGAPPPGAPPPPPPPTG